MKTSEEILQHHYIHDRGLNNPEYVTNAMKAYARQVAEAVREECVQQTYGIDPFEIHNKVESIDIEQFIK